MKGETLYWYSFGRELTLQTVTTTLDVRSITGKGNGYVGLACMTSGDSGFPSSYYSILVSREGVLQFLVTEKGRSRLLQDAGNLAFFDPKDPPVLVMSCESRRGEAYLSAFVGGFWLFTARDTSPLPAGGAAVLVGNSGKPGSWVIRFDAIAVIAQTTEDT